MPVAPDCIAEDTGLARKRRLARGRIESAAAMPRNSNLLPNPACDCGAWPGTRAPGGQCRGPRTAG